MSKAVVFALLVFCSACAGSDTTDGEPSGPHASDASIGTSAKSSDAAKGGDAGGAHSDGASQGKADAGAAATFSAIYPLLFPAMTRAKCNTCHGMPASQVSNGKLFMGMTQDAAYAALFDKTSTSMDCGGMVLVKPGEPEASLFYLKGLDPPPCGSQMPLGPASAHLSAAQSEMIHSWIAAGAKND